MLLINKNILYLYVMNTIFKKYHFFLLVSILLISMASCKKGGEPVPSFDQSEFLSKESDDPSIKDVGPDDKGGGDIVGGDDNEDDDGGGISDGDNDGDDGDVKGGGDDNDSSQGSGASSKAG